MRTTMLVVLCSFATGCAPLGNPGGSTYEGDGPDGGVDGAAVGGPCNEVETVTMNLNIATDAGFSNLPTSCWKLNGTLTIAGTGVKSLAKLGDLRGVTDLELNNTSLTTFDTMSTVEVSGDIWVRYNEKLTDIAKLAAKDTVDSITIEHNPALLGLGGVSKATIVIGQTTILDNLKLTKVDLTNAQRLNGGLYVGDNPLATTLDIARLQSVGSFTIANNAALTTLTGSTLLQFVHGTLTIDNNDSLATLGQFGNAVQIDTNLVVTGNSRLADVGGLARATRIFGIAQVSSNTALNPTRAHDIGCCVATSGFTAAGNQNTQCTGDHWCLNTQQCFR
jgi:hypothetical protein